MKNFHEMPPTCHNAFLRRKLHVSKNAYWREDDLWPQDFSNLNEDDTLK